MVKFIIIISTSSWCSDSSLNVGGSERGKGYLLCWVFFLRSAIVPVCLRGLSPGVRLLHQSLSCLMGYGAHGETTPARPLFRHSLPVRSSPHTWLGKACEKGRRREVGREGQR